MRVGEVFKNSKVRCMDFNAVLNNYCIDIHLNMIFFSPTNETSLSMPSELYLFNGNVRTVAYS